MKIMLVHFLLIIFFFEINKNYIKSQTFGPSSTTSIISSTTSTSTTSTTTSTSTTTQSPEEGLKELSQITLNSTNFNETLDNLDELVATLLNNTQSNPSESLSSAISVLDKISEFVGSINVTKDQTDSFFDISNNVINFGSQSLNNSNKPNSNITKLPEIVDKYLENLNNANFNVSINFQFLSAISAPVTEGLIGFESKSNLSFLNSGNGLDFGSINTAGTINTNLSNFQRLSFVVYKDNKIIFNEEENLLNDEVASIVGLGDLKKTNLTTLYFKVNKVRTNGFAECVYWNTATRNWDSNGCSYNLTQDNKFHVCTCNHTTNFAVLFRPTNIRNQERDIVLDILNYVGSSLSIVGLLITIVVHGTCISAGRNRRVKNSAATFMFKDLKSVLIAFCVSLLAFNMFYLLSNLITVNISTIAATVFAVLLHYSLMVSFFYMLSLGICQYYVYNKTYTVIYHYTKISFVICVGIPLIPTIAMLATNVNNYQQRVDDSYWITFYPSIFTVIVPVLLIVFINLIFFVLIIRNQIFNTVLGDTSEREKSRARQRVKARVFVITTTSIGNMGLAYITLFGLFISDSNTRRPFEYIFVIVNSLQGFWIFLAYVVMSSINFKR